MATIVTRSGKGSPLSIAEGDANFTNLNTDKIENVVEDTTPQLGGNLDVNGNSIVSVSNGDITISADGTGVINVAGFKFDDMLLTSVDAADGLRLQGGSTSDGISLDDAVKLGGGDFDTNGQNIVNNASANPDINIDPHSTGNVILDGITYPATDGTNGQVLTTNGSGTLSFTTIAGATGNELENVSEDTTPQLGGNLDVQGFNLTTSTTNGDIQLNPNGSGYVDLNSQTKINGNLEILGGNNIKSATDQDLTLQASGTGSVVLTGTQVELNQPIMDFGTVAKITASNSVDVVSDTLIVGSSTASTDALITTFPASNCNLKLRGQGTGSIVMDDPVELVGGNLDVGNQEITTSTTNGNIVLANNGTGLTTVNSGSGLSISTGYLNTGTNTNLTLSPNGSGAVVVNAATSGMLVVNTASSGYGSITGDTGVGIGISANAGAQAATDSKILVTSGGGLTLQAGSGSAATLTGNTVGITGTTTITGDTTITGGDFTVSSGNATTLDLFTNYVHDIVTDATATGTYTPSAASGNVIYMIPQGNLTINDFASGSIDPGQSITIFFDQSSYSTSYTLTMGSNFLFPGGTAPTLTATGNDLLTMTCLDDGSVSGGNIYIANFVANYQ